MIPVCYKMDSCTVMIVLFLILMAGCGDNPVQQQLGTLKVVLTDAPFPATSVASVTVSISKIEARNKAEENSDFTVLAESIQTYDLLNLQNGVTADLANLPLPTGIYDQVRIFIGEASVTLSDGRTFPMTIPSGTSSGLKIFISPAIEVQPQVDAELMLDFDVGQSFVVKGNPDTPAGINGFIFKPVIRAINTSNSGRITGTIRNDADAPLEGVMVSAIQQNAIITTAFTDETGQFTIMALPSGTYTVTAEKQDFVTVQEDEISVTAGNAVVVDIQLSPQ